MIWRRLNGLLLLAIALGLLFNAAILWLIGGGL